MNLIWKSDIPKILVFQGNVLDGETEYFQVSSLRFLIVHG